MTRRPRHRHRLGDRGSVTSEMVLYAPLLFGLILLGVQLAMWGLAQLAVQYSANHALQTTRVFGGTATAGHADAEQVLAQAGTALLHEHRIDVSRTADTATVTISAKAPRVVPFLHLSVSTRVSAPVERFRPAPAAPEPRQSPGQVPTAVVA
jgi:hypothetical protein